MAPGGDADTSYKRAPANPAKLNAPVPVYTGNSTGVLIGSPSTKQLPEPVRVKFAVGRLEAEQVESKLAVINRTSDSPSKVGCLP